MGVKFRRKIRAWGGSVGVVLPTAVLEALDLIPGDIALISVDDSHIIIEKGEEKR